MAMPPPLAPGVYVDELTFHSKPIEGVATSATGFIAGDQRGPVLGPITSFAEFLQVVGPNPSVNLFAAVRGFFDNGGRICYVARIGPGDPLQLGLQDLADRPISIVCSPDEYKFSNAAAVITAECENRKDRFAILQSPQPVIPTPSHQVPVHSSFAAYYHPWIITRAPAGATTVTVPPCGHIAATFVRTDEQRGVWVSPANAVLLDVTGFSQAFTAAETNLLTSRGINLLENLSPQGFVVTSAETTSQDSLWKYVNVRRFMIYLEQSMRKGLQWVVFESNGPALWEIVRRIVVRFMVFTWKQGAFKTETQEDSFFVRCDQETMTQNDISSGRLVCLVGVAPSNPAEFIVIRITIQTQ